MKVYFGWLLRKVFSEKMTIDSCVEYLMTKQSSQNLEEKNASRGKARTKALTLSGLVVYMEINYE